MIMPEVKTTIHKYTSQVLACSEGIYSLELNTMFMLIERKLKEIIRILNFVRFSGKKSSCTPLRYTIYENPRMRIFLR